MNAINKPNDVSMFKVGDKIIFAAMGNSVMEYQQCLEMFTSQGLIRHATPEEIAAGHRIDKCKCVATRTYENGMCNKCGLQDIGDDSHIENHVSPLCKMGVK